MEQLRPLKFREAIAYFRSKGYAPELQRFSHLDHWREEHARNFVVAKAMQDDVLTTIREELDRTLDSGQTLEHFQKQLIPRLQKRGWWGQQEVTDPLTGERSLVQLGSQRRLRTIFDTNMRTAHAAGHWAQVQRTKRSFPYLQYLQVERPTKRHSHEAYDGKVFHVDDPIWLKIYPPNGFFCGCRAQPMTQKEFEQSGLALSRGEDVETRPYTNPRTGEVTEVPLGVHPGFSSNPGAAWLDLERQVDELLPETSATERTHLRGIAQHLRVRHAYDDRRVAVTTDIVGAPVDTHFAPKADPERAFPENLPVPQGGEIVTLQLTEAPFVYDELHLMLTTGARAITTVGPGGGSLARATPGPALQAIMGPAREEVDVIQAMVGRMNQQMERLAALSQEDANAIFRHAFLLVLERAGAIRYTFVPSERLRQLYEAHTALIADLVGETLL
ncbi:phage minor head protein [Maritimibacter alkaliphilus]|uniref:phage head morphogenesis protein n=1 Tax=Maritimibacter alkaliphilus TaxID=404236 RepID=UPI001C977692|nr:phage minor head protein [Maritimibacter alkaliphilus]MBY6091066.1 minor capsid protein [Maritimibacter alkaliphilus]